MKTIILAGGTGTMGKILQDHFVAQGMRVVVLTRHPEAHRAAGVTYLPWNATSTGDWAQELDGAAALINLAGRSVDCRYTEENKALIRNSRVDATHALGRAVAKCERPPAIWINMSSATVYRHAEDRAMDEASGELGTDFSPQVVLAWEKAFFEHARKGVRQVAVRCAMVFGKQGGALPRFVQLVKAGMGGRHGSGTQYVSWVHETDVAHFFQWLLDDPKAEGTIDLAAPNPLPQHELMRALRARVKPWFHVDVPRWALQFGAILLRTETELVLKSRRVVPTKALAMGFRFRFPHIGPALDHLLNEASPAKARKHPEP